MIPTSGVYFKNMWKRILTYMWSDDASRVDRAARFLLMVMVACSVWRLALSVAAAVDALPPVDNSVFGDPEMVGRIESDRILECSGMDASTLDDDLLWAVNDSGNGPFLYALGKDGRHRGRVEVVGAANRDWEGIDTFVWRGRSMILIADFGDNHRRHDRHTLYVIAEPRLVGDRFKRSTTADVVWRIDYSYPDGRYDAEGVAVDTAAEQILVLTKRDTPPLLFALPFSAASPSNLVTARQVGTLDQIPPPTDQDRRHRFGSLRSQPTALDLSADGRMMVVLTYKHAYLFSRHADLSWPSALKQPPALLRLPLPEDHPDLRQREAICFARDDMSILVTSEGRHPGMYALEAK